MYRSIAALAVFVTACSGASSTSTTTSTTEPPPPDPGYVAWTSEEGVFVQPMPDGEALRLGPEGDAFPTQPTPSPDGQLVWTELTPTSSTVAIGDLAGDVERLQAPTAPFYYSWAPDGEKLAFLGSGPGSLIFGIIENGEARAVDNGAPYYFDWAPDSESLFVHRVGNDMGVLTLDGERVVIDESPEVFQAPQWTDEGVVYAAPGAGTFARGGVLLATADNPADLVIASTPGEDPEVVVTLDSFTAFDRAGDRIAVLSFPTRPTGSLAVIDISTGETIETSDEVLAHRWSPDGSKLLVLRAPEVGEAVWSVWQDGTLTDLVAHIPTTTFIRDYLPFWDQYSRSLTLWSPNSDAFTFAGQVDGEQLPGIYVQYLDGTRDRLDDGVFSVWGRTGQ